MALLNRFLMRLGSKTGFCFQQGGARRDVITSYSIHYTKLYENRPLKTRADFIRFQGERIKIETHDVIEGRRKFTGILEKTNDDSVTIAVDGRSFDIAGTSIRNNFV